MSTKDDPPPALLPLGARVGLNTDHALGFLEKLQELCLEFNLAIDETDDMGLALVPLNPDDTHPAGVYLYFSIGDDAEIDWSAARAGDERPDSDVFVLESPK